MDIQQGQGTGPLSKGGTMNWLNLLNQMLSQYGGIIQGTGTPQELPWFKGFQEQIARYGKDQDAELIKQAIARGLTGNSLAGVIAQNQEARNKGILNAINQVYQGAPEQVSNLGKMISDFFLKKKQMDLSYLANKNSQQQGNPLTSMLPQLISRGLGAVGGAFVGGPPGAMLGSQIGGTIGGTAGGSSGSIFGNRGTLDFSSQMPTFDWSKFFSGLQG